MTSYSTVSAYDTAKGAEREAGLTAGDEDHAGVGQGLKWVRNSIAHTLVVLSTTAPALNGGEPEKSGGAKHGRKRKRQLSSALF